MTSWRLRDITNETIIQKKISCKTYRVDKLAWDTKHRITKITTTTFNGLVEHRKLELHVCSVVGLILYSVIFKYYNQLCHQASTTPQHIFRNLWKSDVRPIKALYVSMTSKNGEGFAAHLWVGVTTNESTNADHWPSRRYVLRALLEIRKSA